MQESTAANQNRPGRVRPKGWLARLARDQKGNTLAIVGAALVPLTAMIGSGVDMSRAYMAKNRMQAACDAAALAGRRAMTNDTLTTQVTSEATKFFNFNFPQATYQTAAFTPTVTRPSAGVVQVHASTTIPTNIMKIFGFTTLPVEVTCDASLNFVNTDVLLVLDTTGSMLESVNGTVKITALREAVMALYDALAPVQTQLASNGLRLRYGVVPYSSTVNVGGLIRAVNPDYLTDNAEYQTRMALYNTPTYIGTPGTPEPPVTQVYNSGAAISQARCDLYGQNQAFSGFTPSPSTGGGPAPSPTWSRAYSNNEAEGQDWGYPGASDTNGGSQSCRRRYVETDTTYVTDYTFTNYSYEAESIDVSQYKLGTPVAIASSNNGRVDVGGTDLRDPLELARDGIGVSTTNVTWNGCIEERQTNNTISATSGYTIPADAYDLNINFIPNSDATRWRPRFPQIAYYRSSVVSLTSANSTSGSPVESYNAYQYNACPTEARRLTTWTRGDMQSYVNSLDPDGYTYHDIGMIWGARLISSSGIFADSTDTFNGMPVTRHVIFMTDGDMNPITASYGAYGIEGIQKRVLGTAAGSEHEPRHNQRFKMICNATKGMNVSIWVIAFGTSLTPEMADCASNANQTATITTRDALIAKFTEIGNNIGALRLTQ
jgi:Flp pilus assembly protein TadG